MAHARIERPARRERPGRLQIFIDVVHVVVLIASKRAVHAEDARSDRTGKVLEPASMLGEAIGCETRDDGERPRSQLRAMREAEVRPQIVPFEIDHAAGTGDRRLRSHRNRLELLRGSRSAVHQDAHAVVGIELMLDDGAGLCLREALPGIELQRRWIHAPGIAFELRTRQSERILRALQVDGVGDQCEGGLRVGFVRELRVTEIATRPTVSTRSFRFEMTGADDIADTLRRCCRCILERADGLEAHSQRRVASSGKRRNDARAVDAAADAAALLRERLHDAAR